MKTRWLQTSVVLLIVVTLATGVALALRSRMPLLLDKSVSLGNILSLGPTIRATNCDWFWMSDHEVLVMRPNEAWLPAGSKQLVSAMRADVVDTLTLDKRDLDTHLAMEMQSVQEKYGPVRPDPISLSPDGQKVLWRPQRDLPSIEETVCTSVGGKFTSVHVTERPVRPSAFLWRLDSRAWYRLSFGFDGLKELTEVEADTGRELRTFALPSTQITEARFWLTRNGRLLACHPSFSGQTPVFVCVEMEIGKPDGEPRRSSFKLPSAGRLADMSYSPATDRFAFIFRYDAHSPSRRRRGISSFVDRWLGVRTEPVLTEVWTCRRDGSGMKLLGVRTDVPGFSSPPMPVDRCAWAPGGKELAYTYGSDLYLVRVD